MSAVGMLTSWRRIPSQWAKVVEGIWSTILVVILSVLPFFFWLSPLIALLARASDRRDAEQARKVAEQVKLRIHVWGSEVHARDSGREE
ncbi:hypothetical protein [Cupriavidus metallidurans]|uniref:hypothetical protein n=1 Tax=Cupriavidus metallidurans TaxID=119219 RepID=UPI000AB0430B|nr:hypothetical protein [Cupriavidus metallidurans]